MKICLLYVIVLVVVRGYAYYAPQTGRWMSREPIGEEEEVNLYRFCGNNPLLYFDLFGLKKWIMIYYDRDTDASFRRAAETAKREVEAGPSFDSKCDEVLLFAVGNAGKFEETWKTVKNKTSGDDPKLKIQEVHLFTHSGPGVIFMQYGTMLAPAIKALPRLNWMPDGRIVCHGCNSGVCDQNGNSVAGSFADGQYVISEGQTGFSQFSERPDRRTCFSRVGPDSQTVYLWSYGDGGHDWTFGTARPSKEFKHVSGLGMFLW